MYSSAYAAARAMRAENRKTKKLGLLSNVMKQPSIVLFAYVIGGQNSSDRTSKEKGISYKRCDYEGGRPSAF